jgi:hypothetical protein
MAISRSNQRTWRGERSTHVLIRNSTDAIRSSWRGTERGEAGARDGTYYKLMIVGPAERAANHLSYRRYPRSVENYHADIESTVIQKTS